MPACTALGTKSRIRVACVSRGSAPGTTGCATERCDEDVDEPQPASANTRTASIASAVRVRRGAMRSAGYEAGIRGRLGYLAEMSAPFTSPLAEAIAPDLLDRFLR